MKVILFQLIFSILLCITNTYAQKFSSSTVMGAGRTVMYTKFVGVIGNKEIRSNVTNGFTKYNYNLLVYENGRQHLKRSMQVSYNDAKYVPDGYFIKGDKIVGYFIAGTKNTEVVKLCLQEFNTNLEQIGNPIEITELPKAIDPTKTLDMRSGGMFKDKIVRRQDLTAMHDNRNGTVLFCFSLQLTEEYDVSYAKAILIDRDYVILNSFDYQAQTSENHIKIVPQKIFENDDALLTISEGVNAPNSTGNIVFNISKQTQMYVPSNGNAPKELELLPDQSHILNIKTAENLGLDGDVVYGIQSVLNKGYIGLYKYNVKSEKLERYSYAYGTDFFFPNKRHIYPGSFKLHKIYNLTDGATLIWLLGEGYERGYGDLFLKIGKNNEFLWLKNVRQEATGRPQHTEAIDYFDKDGNLNLVFNCHPKLMKDNKLINKVAIADLGSISVQATLDIDEGHVTYKKLNAPSNLKIRGIDIRESKNLGENGRYLMHMVVNKKLQFIEVDFNAN